MKCVGGNVAPLEKGSSWTHYKKTETVVWFSFREVFINFSSGDVEVVVLVSSEGSS